MANKIYCAFLYGQGGKAVDVILSMGGMDRLTKRVRSLSPDITVDQYNWNHHTAIVNKIKTLPLTTKIVIGGASLGANETPRVCIYINRQIDFIFGIQPSSYGAKNIIPANVKAAICYYTPWWWPITFGFGNYAWQKSSSKTRLAYAHNYAPHPGDNDEATQLSILANIRAML